MQAGSPRRWPRLGAATDAHLAVIAVLGCCSAAARCPSSPRFTRTRAVSACMALPETISWCASAAAATCRVPLRDAADCKLHLAISAVFWCCWSAAEAPVHGTGSIESIVEGSAWRCCVACSGFASLTWVVLLNCCFWGVNAELAGRVHGTSIPSPIPPQSPVEPPRTGFWP